MPRSMDRSGPRDNRRSSEAGESWDVFLSGIRNARAQLKNPAPVWYRGHWHSTYPLLPSLLRTSRGLSKEQELFHKYRQAATYLLKARESDWEAVFDMQHCGIDPTLGLDRDARRGCVLRLGHRAIRGCCVCPRPDGAQSSSHWHAATQACRRPELLLPLRILEEGAVCSALADRSRSAVSKRKTIRSARNVHDPW